MPPGRSPRLAAAAGLALLATAAPSWLARGSGPGAALAALTGLHPTALRFDEPAARFTAYTGETVRHAYRFRNPTGHPVRITATDATCGCVRATATPRYVEPGATGTVDVAAALDGRYGPQHFRVRVRTDEGADTGVLLTLGGDARTVVRPEPWRWLAGPLEPGKTARTRIDLRWTSSPRPYEVEARGDCVAVERRGDALEVSIEAPWRAGNHFDGVLLRVRPEDAARVVETWIPVVWLVEPALSVEPGTLELRDGAGAVVVRERWPGMVPLARVDTGDLPLRVEWTRSDTGTADLRVVLTGSELDLPLGARLALVPEPAGMGVLEVPVVVRRTAR